MQDSLQRSEQEEVVKVDTVHYTDHSVQQWLCTKMKNLPETADPGYNYYKGCRKDSAHKSSHMRALSL